MISMHETIEWNAVIRVDRQFANFDFFPFSTLSCICPSPLSSGIWEIQDRRFHPFFLLLLLFAFYFRSITHLKFSISN